MTVLQKDKSNPAMIKFRSKFQFQILLQFYRAGEKVAKKLNL